MGLLKGEGVLFVCLFVCLFSKGYRTVFLFCFHGEFIISLLFVGWVS